MDADSCPTNGTTKGFIALPDQGNSNWGEGIWRLQDGVVGEVSE